jgi:hypothetical protein
MDCCFTVHMKRAKDLLESETTAISTPQSCFMNSPFFEMHAETEEGKNAVLSASLPSTNTAEKLTTLHAEVALPLGLYYIFRALNHSDRELDIGNGATLMSLDQIASFWEAHKGNGQRAVIAIGACYLGMGHIGLVCMVVDQKTQLHHDKEKRLFTFHAGGSNGWERSERESHLWNLDTDTIPHTHMYSWEEFVVNAYSAHIYS